MRREYHQHGPRSIYPLEHCLLLLPMFLAILELPSLRAQDVLTYHNDNARTGQNLSETILTLSSVNSAQFGKLFQLSVDGKVDAQPLYAAGVNLTGQGSHNVLYVATEHDSVYAFDADTGAQLWRVSLLGAGETTSDDHGCGQIIPEIGITSTPVIDRSSGPHGTIYAVAMSKDSSAAYHQRLHALDMTIGSEEFGGPKEVQATFPGKGDNTNGTNVIFDPGQYAERAGLLLLNQVIYTGWTSHCDQGPYTAWVIAYSESTLNQVNVLNLTPNGHEGSIWMSGAGLAADSTGNIYPLIANGTFDTTLNGSGFPSQGDYGNAFMRLSTANGGLTVADYFTMSNSVSESNADEDLGSGGALVLPDMTDATGATRHLAVGAGKDQAIYLVDRDKLGKFNSQGDSIYQELLRALPGGIWSMPAYFNGRLYFGPVGNNLLAFQFANARLQTTPVSSTTTSFAYPGATPSVSANGTSNAIVWATENTSPAVLHAYDATDLSHELYNSSQAGTRDPFGAGNKFITPTVTHGKVYVGTTNGVGVFGLLSSGADFAMSVSTGSPASATVAPGQTAQYALSVAAMAGFNQAVSFTCSGAPAGANCSVSPASATPSGSSGTPLMVSVSTTAASLAVWRRWRGQNAPLVMMGLLSLIPLVSLFLAAKPGRGRASAALRACALAVTLGCAGCGGTGGGGSVPMSNPGTPAGTYTLTVTGSSTSNSTPLTHNVPLQLIVT